MQIMKYNYYTKIQRNKAFLKYKNTYIINYLKYKSFTFFMLFSLTFILELQMIYHYLLKTQKLY